MKIKLIVFVLIAVMGVSVMTGCMGGKTVSEDTREGQKSAEQSLDQIPQTTSINFEKYVGFIGLDKESLIKQIGEEPTIIDEGGLDFAKLGIRAWFKDGRVSQIFTQNTDVDFNGAKIGDSIERFTEAFGPSISDQNGDMHFKYNDIFLSVNYDTDTRKTIAAYILAEDF